MMNTGFNIDRDGLTGWTHVIAVSKWYGSIDQVLESEAYVGYLENTNSLDIFAVPLMSITKFKVIFRRYPQIEHGSDYDKKPCELYRFTTRYSYI